MSQPEPPIILETGTRPTAAVIWLHGLGADGHDFESLVPALNLPDTLAIRFVFPHAPKRPVTINGGMVMRAWYDISPADNGFRDNDDDIRASAVLIAGLVDQQLAQGMPAHRIVLAGFSQGGAVAIYTALGSGLPLAGVMALSTYVPMAGSFEQWAHTSNREKPVFQGHGTFDPLISIRRAEQTRDLLIEAGCPVEWHQYDMDHSVCMEEIDDISRWLVRVLG
ncbi:MAG: dienelactone hydrolase family protein [Acidiferrobacterales bacterium]|jgi:phospholipase/carboxylesterase|nr:dienelactone hydrolase family protein [Acidiferrobacterales bacterium]